MTYDPVQMFSKRLGHELPELERVDFSEVSADSERAGDIFHRLAKSADAGSLNAMSLCSACCRAGWGCSINHEKALSWARKAANAGYPPGYFELGRCYEDGIGVVADKSAAMHAFVAAASGGYAQAALALALRYHAEKDFESAVRYAVLATELGDPWSPFQLASWYERGDGFPVDFELAVRWYQVAAKMGSGMANHRLASAYRSGELGLQRNWSSAEAYAKAIELAPYP